MPKLGDFEGRWRIARRIEDHWMGTTGLFEGVARFTADGTLEVRDDGPALRS